MQIEIKQGKEKERKKKETVRQQKERKKESKWVSIERKTKMMVHRTQ